MKKTIQAKKRLRFLLILCALVVVLIGGRLFYLQLLNDEYKQKMFELTRKTIELYPTRGQITDRDGAVLAYDESAYLLYLFPEEIEDKDAVREELLANLPSDPARVDAWLSDTDTVRADIELTQEQADALTALQLRGISVVTQNQRRYPQGDLAGSLIGFTNLEHAGVVGLEAYYDDELRGIPGKTQLFSYGGGVPVPYEQQTQYPAKKGHSLELTIDAALQEIVRTEGKIGFERMTPEKMSILVMNPKTGEILAWADFPSLDATNPRAGRTETEKKALQAMDEEEKLMTYFDMWRSFTAQDVYEPGSVFKLVTAAAAWEEGTATDESTYFCDGSIRDIPGVVIRCWSHDDPHGELDFTGAMDESCNPSFVQMIRALGKEKSREYMEAFGFGKQTGIGFPSEAEGILPPGPEEINESTFATNSYGHGVAVTPLQMLSAIGAMANGGTLMEPQLIHAVTDAQGEGVQRFSEKPLRTVISEDTSKRMLALMEHGVEHGTADGAYLPGYRVGGKTGTSVKFVDGAYRSDVVVGSWGGVFPANDPEIALLVVVDEPKDSFSGNTTAAPVAKAILEAYIELKEIEPLEETRPEEDSSTENPLTWPEETEWIETDEIGRVPVPCVNRV